MMRWRESEFYIGTWCLPTPTNVLELIHSLEKLGVQSYAYRRMDDPEHIDICYRSEQDLTSLIRIKVNELLRKQSITFAETPLARTEEGILICPMFHE